MPRCWKGGIILIRPILSHRSRCNAFPSISQVADLQPFITTLHCSVHLVICAKPHLFCVLVTVLSSEYSEYRQLSQRATPLVGLDQLCLSSLPRAPQVLGGNFPPLSRNTRDRMHDVLFTKEVPQYWTTFLSSQQRCPGKSGPSDDLLSLSSHFPRSRFLSFSFVKAVLYCAHNVNARISNAFIESLKKSSR